MATRKKTTKKKPAQATVKRTVAKKTKKQDFWQVKFTINTVYWLVIGIAAIAAALFTYTTNQRMNDIYDQVQIQSQQNQ